MNCAMTTRSYREVHKEPFCTREAEFRCRVYNPETKNSAEFPLCRQHAGLINIAEVQFPGLEYTITEIEKGAK